MQLFNKTRQSESGFTVTEMVVIAAIIIVILSTLISAYPQFRNRSSLATLARKVALVVREAQVFGLAVREFPRGVVGPESFDITNFPPYGVHISMINGREIILFADVFNVENAYDRSEPCGLETSECVRRIKLASAEEIFDLCILEGGGSQSSNQNADFTCGMHELDITFRRPDPEAIIYAKPTETSLVEGPYNAAEIHLRSNRLPGKEKVVRVWVSGQISIE